MCLNLNLKPKYDLYMYQNFVLHFLNFIHMPEFMAEHDLHLDQKKSHFAKITGFKNLKKKVVLQIFR